MGVPVVACVSSAGGLPALASVLAGLPTDFEGSVIALMHQGPTRPVEALSRLLTHKTGVPCVPAVAGQVLAGGSVVIAPPGSHMLVRADRTVELVDDGPVPPARPSADLLLATLAMAAGADVIAVILSGYGHDGSIGAATVHQLGGTVIATDEATSEVFGMPKSAAERIGVVDHIMPLPDIGALLGRLMAARIA